MRRFFPSSPLIILVLLPVILLTACAPPAASSTAGQIESKLSLVSAGQPVKETAVSATPLPWPTATPIIVEGERRPLAATTIPRQTSARTADPTATPENDLYQLPLGGEMNVDWIISNYVDHDWEAYQSLDYHHGSMTYDGHTGTDFLLRDLTQMYDGVSVLAARAGQVIDLYDLADDEEWMGAETNFITIEHADGSRAIYQHIRQHSATVAIDDAVYVGQPIALIGNSGNSANPHLHFEVRSANGRLIDIFAEGLAGFDYPYPEKPYVFQAGVTQLTDPAIDNDMFRYTPAATAVLPTTASPTFWYKAVRLQASDRLQSILVHPDGTHEELFTLQAEQNLSIVSWYIYANPLPPGWYSVWYYFNDEVTSSQTLSFQVVP